jgi:hypothetical protein
MVDPEIDRAPDQFLGGFVLGPRTRRITPAFAATAMFRF